MYTEKSAQHGFWTAPGKLFVQHSQTLVIAWRADAVLKKRGILELTERSREWMFKGIRFVWTIETGAHLLKPHSFY